MSEVRLEHKLVRVLRFDDGAQTALAAAHMAEAFDRVVQRAADEDFTSAAAEIACAAFACIAAEHGFALLATTCTGLPDD